MNKLMMLEVCKNMLERARICYDYEARSGHSALGNLPYE